MIVDPDIYDHDGTYIESFRGTDPINNSLLEIPGLSDTYFAVFKSTTDYFYSGSAVSRFAQAFIDLSTFEVVDSNGVELSFSIDSVDTVTPGTMIYYNPFFL